MYAMQYEITLPADYDMQIIRTRVATGGRALDDLPGLGVKAYAIRERGVLGSPVNEYAPIYLWNDTGSMARFVAGGGGFQNIIRDFGRPVVRHWTGLACHAGPSRAPYPRSASRRLTPIPAGPGPDATGLGLATAIEQGVDDLRQLAGQDGVHTAALAIDPHHWQLARFVLWNEAVATDEDETERYELLHLSGPGLAELPDGRVW
ncbi:MAG: DUF4865 family protein [Actinomycetales bacterium]|nr:DUF4865 family protein [Actinomycetales bacterium]